MESFKKPLVISHFVFVLILVFFDVSLATTEKMTENQKSTYIVHVSKSEIPASFEHHSVWYKSILKSISVSAEMLYIYDNAIHGFSTRLTPEESRLLKSQTGILKLLPDKMYKLHTTRTPQFLGIDKIPGMFPESNTGTDVVIGLLDTGVWPESKSFDDTGLGPIPSSWKGECETGTNFTTSNCNKKLIGARFFPKGHEASNGPVDETKQFRSPRDSDGHGTHTASTAAGSAVEGASLFGYANGTARGMAKGARVAVYKVCWEEACAVSDILAAIDKAISDGVHVLSVSIGGGAIDYDEDTLAIGAFSAMEKGILISSSAGNSGPNASSLTNLAPWITTVGAGTLDRDFPAYVSLGNGQNFSGVSLYNGNPLPHTPVSFVYAGNASIGVGEGGELCAAGSLAPEKVAGKIVLCDRGDLGRAEKGSVVKSAGGLGMVLANQASDGEELVADPHLLPATAVGSKEGEAIKKYLFSNPKPTATIVFEGTKVDIQPSPVVAAFSSRGPNPITPQILKPDFIAPGVDILAAWTEAAGPTNIDSDARRVDFNIISGTSMSCPHVSGLAALIKSAHPDWSPAAIRSALMTTAYTAYKNGQKLLDSATQKPATPLDFGAGHVNPVAALNPGLVYDLTVDDYLNFLCALNYTADRIEAVARRKYKCDPKKQYSVNDLNYPSFAVVFESAGGNGGAKIKHTRTLTNVGPPGKYKVSVTSDTAFVNVSVEPEELSFNEKEKKSYTVTFAASGSKPKSPFSFGRLEWSDGKNVVGSPISFSWGE
ncbi:subtilisin-like protease SBT1.7 [Gastrolobium bilobum]|uniref:subtilisin-like protease SBT1.7 n=1 Tax=Gastrolobium bilobum TaxID=150636 RepID=UPI002AB085BA|nr:subtilisin-like protease SBT1.7 [Gastrolobium bilobum]